MFYVLVLWSPAWATLFNDISSLTLSTFLLGPGLLKDPKQCVIRILFDALSKGHGELTVHKWQMALGFGLPVSNCMGHHLFPQLLLKLTIVSHVFYLLSLPRIKPL